MIWSIWFVDNAVQSDLISFSQQEFLLESIRKVPELVESKKQMANQIEKEENEISEKNKIFSTQEEKIKSMEIESKGTISILGQRILPSKVGRVFPWIIVVSFLSHTEYGPNDCRDDTPHFRRIYWHEYLWF